ncbi:MAG: hypothetical protein L0Y71_17340 [Gemmataceae bacterium]|nr:hypothetical protein [Gemmataceae bacterium]
MHKKPVRMLILTILLLGGIAGGVVAALKHEPGFYQRIAIEAGGDRTRQSDEFMKQFFTLLNRVYDTRRGKWTFNFTQEQINSYFEEDFVRLKDAEAFAKLGIHAPRVQLENDTMRLAFRYGSGFWSTVLTYEVRVWLVPTEANTLAVEILHRKAGGLPIAAQSLLNDLKELARNRSIDVSWYRRDGNPVALIRFPSNRSRPSAQLLRFEVVNGRLTIEGQSFEPTLPPSESSDPEDS